MERRELAHKARDLGLTVVIGIYTPSEVDTKSNLNGPADL
jgi:hypothetical protein